MENLRSMFDKNKQYLEYGRGISGVLDIDEFLGMVGLIKNESKNKLNILIGHKNLFKFKNHIFNSNLNRLNLVELASILSFSDKTNDLTKIIVDNIIYVDLKKMKLNCYEENLSIIIDNDLDFDPYEYTIYIFEENNLLNYGYYTIAH